MLLAGLSATLAQSPPIAAQQSHAVPAEEKRLNAAVFRRGLKERGLFDLLDFYLREFPPQEQAERLSLQRDILLARFADSSLPGEERLAAIAEANQLLAELIEITEDAAKRLELAISLARSLLYDEGEPYFTSILYRGGSSADRRRLQPITEQAVTLLTNLRAEITGEYERIDNLSVRDFEKLEHRGYIDLLDRLAPQCDYLLMWALFYDALPREDDDLVRAARLNRAMELIEENEGLLRTPHETSGVQIQGLLLTGMIYRRLNNHVTARQAFDGALLIADRLTDPAVSAEAAWAVTLAHVERIRTEIDSRRYDEALNGLDRFREVIARQRRDDFALRLVAALLERAVYQERFEDAKRGSDAADMARHQTAAWKPLARLAEHEPAHRDEIYATLYDLLEPDTDPATLGPFEQCALLAGLLFEASQRSGSGTSPDRETAAMLERAVAVGETFNETAGAAERELVPEVLYNLGVALYRLGRSTDAASRFLAIARDYPAYARAHDAAVLAVEICSELWTSRPASHENTAFRALYGEAMGTLVAAFPTTPEARYWRFFLAQLLEQNVEYDRAAAHYGQVHVEHEHYLESVALRVRCLASGLEQKIRDEPHDRLGIRQRADEFNSAQREFVTLVQSLPATEDHDERMPRIRHLLAQNAVLAAEVSNLPQIENPNKALEAVAGFEDQFPEERALIGRVLRARLMAYDKLGRIDEALEAIPAYVASDPEGAGPTLQGLYVTLVAEIEKLEDRGDEEGGRRKAQTALLMARHIYEWAKEHEPSTEPLERRPVSIQLAQAHLRAGFYERARELFARCLGLNELREGTEREAGENESVDGALTVDSADPVVLLGYAESLYQLKRYADALPIFNRIAVALPPEQPERWQALLRDLQCRTALNEPPKGIVKVIEQQKYLHPDLGGEKYAKEFQRLLRENERRSGK